MAGLLVAVCALVCAALAAADDGAWRIINTNAGPTTGHFAGSTSGDGYMWVAGGDANYNGTAQYSWVNQNWTTISMIPWWVTNYTSPALAWAGGNLFLVGGAVYSIQTNTMWVQSTTSSNTWNMVPAPANAPPARSGHSLPIANGYLFLIGGWNRTNYFGGVWAYDLTQLTSPAVGWQSTAWINLVPDSNTNPRFPPAQSGQSVVVYESTLLLFGGFSHNTAVPFANHSDCSNNPAMQCVFSGDVWVWRVSYPISSTPWFKTTPSNGLKPTPRAFHSAGIVNAETMLIYGGVTSTGPLNDLWAYDISFDFWRQLTPSGTGPALAHGLHVGNTVGRHFLIYLSSTPTKMYAYYPPDPSGSSPTPSSSPVAPVKCSGAHLAGVNAGIVITILLCIATAVFAGWSWKIVRGGGVSAAPKAEAGADAYAVL